MRPIIESMGGTVRFEKTQNTVYFAVGPLMGAYDIGRRTLIDGAYAATIRKDLSETPERPEACTSQRLP